MQTNQLPKIPVELAERIIRAGGLEAWATCEDSRKRHFETMLAGETPHRSPEAGQRGKEGKRKR